MTELLSKLAAYLGSYTNWSRWVGTLLIADIMAVWTKMNWDKPQIVPLDLGTSSILVAVFFVNALKPQTQPPAPPPTTPPTP